MNAEAAELISVMRLDPLAREGGYFTRIWTSPDVGPDGRPCGSTILFLLTEDDFSALHRLRSEEIWNFRAGDPSELVLLDPATGSCSTTILGPKIRSFQVPRRVVGSGVWQGARLQSTGLLHGWALFACALAPAWDEREFELGNREALIREFPAYADAILALTR